MLRRFKFKHLGGISTVPSGFFTIDGQDLADFKKEKIIRNKNLWFFSLLTTFNFK